jgi:guanylate kinase
MKPQGIRAKRAGIILILSAPSGAGKTTLIKRLLKAFPDIGLSISYTTRARRPGELAGRDYHFVTPRKFRQMRAGNAFAEWARVHGFHYGTPRRLLEQKIRSGRDVLLDIDVQGARKIKSQYRDAVSIFLLPPSWRELEKRLALRGTDRRATIRRRLENAKHEMREIIRYDYFVVNREIGKAVGSLKSIITAERLKVSRFKGTQRSAVGHPRFRAES